jgi:uncharacterized protein
MSAERDASLRALNDVHQFPGPFTFKVIGENSADFVARVVQAAVVVLGPTAYPNVRTRESAKGNHQAVTMVVEVGSAEGVLDVYAALSGVSGVRFLL